MIKSFIDTNVFVHWIILSKIKEKRPNDKELWIEYKKIVPSFLLLEKIRSTLNNENCRFLTSQLVISEIFYSMLDEYRCRHMNKDGLPLSSWQRVKDSINLTREETEEVTKDILNFLDKFDIFKTIDDNENICMLISERFDYNLISELVLNHHFRTHDAILVSSAINSDCDFFITGDKSIRNKKIDNIKIISPQTMLQSLKQI